jgi:tRNA uridine 5-carboxymethylaminomethyl modification enzyme
MFTSRAEHRLLLRADNAADRLTPLAASLGLLDGTDLGRSRKSRFAERSAALTEINRIIDGSRIDGVPLADLLRRPDFTAENFAGALARLAPGRVFEQEAVFTARTERFYAAYITRQGAEVRRHAELERRRIPATIDYTTIPSIRNEARAALQRFRPETLGQAARLEGITPADVTLLAVLVRREGELRRTAGPVPSQ